MAKKIHVVTNRGEYLVKFKKEFIWYEIYRWNIEIFIKKKIKIPFIKKEINTYKKVSEFESNCFTYERQIGNFLRLAKEAVRKYEEWLQRQEIIDQIRKELIVPSESLKMVWKKK